MYNKMKIMKLHLAINITIFVVLNCLYNPSSDMFYCGNCLEAYCNIYTTFHIITHRLLAKDDVNLEVTETIHNNGEDYVSLRKNKEITTYDIMNNDKANKLEAYKKSFNYRYAKMKGIKKLDCYCERKIFKGIEKIDKITEGISNKKKLKRIIFKKYMLRIFFLCIFSIFGLLIPLLDNIRSGKTVSGGSRGELSVLKNISIPDSVISLYLVLVLISCIIIFSSSIYTLGKIIKYDELKLGKRII
ncbi:Plasmodium exported protein, unknown function [Plasmodium vivax]|uniref:Variable surface protein n=1 Tax=Plasmodium vivax TaxID=5855 RepID=A0A565A6F6_PLAVI|nr:Plasmodium exported protein, unknown function [Plasmodium vivax]